MLRRKLFGRFLFAPMMEADGGTGGTAGAGGQSPTGGQPGAGTGTGAATGGQTGGQAAAPAFDLEKVMEIVAGAQSVKEDAVLKNYFKQQGLSQEEAAQAIVAFKTEKAKNQPDPTELKKEAETAKETAQKAIVESRAVLLAVELGVDAKSIPYVLKLADMSKATKDDGATDDEAIKTAINKVLEDVPAFKGAAPATTPAGTGKPGYTPKAGGDPGQTSRAAAIAAARKETAKTDNPYANAWGQK